MAGHARSKQRELLTVTPSGAGVTRGSQTALSAAFRQRQVAHNHLQTRQSCATSRASRHIPKLDVAGSIPVSRSKVPRHHGLGVRRPRLASAPDRGAPAQAAAAGREGAIRLAPAQARLTLTPACHAAFPEETPRPARGCDAEVDEAAWRPYHPPSMAKPRGGESRQEPCAFDDRARGRH